MNPTSDLFTDYHGFTSRGAVFIQVYYPPQTTQINVSINNILIPDYSA